MNVIANKAPKLPDRPGKFYAPEAPPPVSVPFLTNWRMWVNLVLLFLMLWTAVYSIESAQWIAPQPAYTLVLFLAMFTVWLMVFARLPGWILHVVAPVFGVLVTMWQATALLPAPAGIGHLLQVLQAWVQGSGALAPAEAKAVFAALLVLVTWLSGYLGTWFIMRKHNPWVAITLGAMVIIVNLSNLPGRYFYFFPGYFIGAVFLIIQTRITRQYARTGKGAGYTTRSLLYLLAPLVCIIVLAASISWITPVARASALQNAISPHLMWRSNIRESSLNVFNAVPAKKSLSTADILKSLPFEGGWNQGGKTMFTVKADHPSYWALHIYDAYTASGWTNTPTTEQVVNAKTPAIDMSSVNPNDIVTYEVTSEINANVLLVGGNFLSADAPVLLKQGSGNEIMEVTSTRMFEPGEHYTVQAVLSNPTAAQLAAARINYPTYITDTYLQLPADFPQDVKDLSAKITEGAATPYDKVVDVVKYLATLPYEPIITAPPPGADGVEYFLFTQKGGFCLYFASAMATMLRSVDVPARLVIGYLPGDPGEVRNTYLLRDWQYHTWVQVYFPGYGWVNFEATPGGGGGSQVPIQTPLISPPAIKELPQWNAWNYPPPIPGTQQANIQVVPPPTTSETSFPRVAFPFAEALGKAVEILLIVALAAGVVYLILFIIRHTFSRQLWHVDRESLAYTTYIKLCRLASLAKLSPRPNQTPLEFAAELKVALPEEAAAIDGIVRAYQENRFGGRQGKLELYMEAEFLKARHNIYAKLLKRAARQMWGLKVLTMGGGV